MNHSEQTNRLLDAVREISSEIGQLNALQAAMLGRLCQRQDFNADEKNALTAAIKRTEAQLDAIRPRVWNLEWHVSISTPQAVAAD